MNEFLERFLHAVSIADMPTAAKALGVLMAPITTFFGVPLLGVLLAFLTLDWLTGLRKAAIQNKVASYKFGVAVDRAVYYLVVYAVVHAITVFVPLGIYAGMPEAAILAIYTLKEALSVFENLRAIQALHGRETSVMDAIIHRLGMDVKRIEDEIAAPTNKDQGSGQP